MYALVHQRTISLGGLFRSKLAFLLFHHSNILFRIPFRQSFGFPDFHSKTTQRIVFHSCKWHFGSIDSMPFSSFVHFVLQLLLLMLIRKIKSLKELPLTQQQLGVNWCRFMCLVYRIISFVCFVQVNENWRRRNWWTKALNAFTPRAPLCA